MSAPTIRKGPASSYAGPNEVIREFSDGRSGGLISMRRDARDRLVVDVYRTDDDVVVRSDRTTPTDDERVRVVEWMTDVDEGNTLLGFRQWLDNQED